MNLKSIHILFMIAFVIGSNDIFAQDGLIDISGQIIDDSSQEPNSICNRVYC